MTGSRTFRLRRHARHPRVVQHLLRGEAFGGIHDDQVRDEVLRALADGEEEDEEEDGEEDGVVLAQHTAHSTQTHDTPT